MEARKFNQDLSTWDVGQVECMSSMFEGAWSFNGKISSWNVFKVRYMSNMFSDARSFNGDICSWDVSNVTDLSRWNMSRCTNKYKMFYNTDSESESDEESYYEE